MKVKLYNNEIVDIIKVGTSTHLFDIKDVEIIQDDLDYWTHLEHQYTGMAMQGILSNNVIMNNIREIKEETMANIVTNFATNLAHALVEKLKEKEERK